MEKPPEQDIDSNLIQEAPTVSFPEGGWRAWATVFGSFLTVTATYGYASAYGVYQDFYVNDFLTDESSSIISLPGSVSLALMFWLGPFTGHYMDHGHFRSIMIIGSAIFVFSMFMLSLAHPGKFYQVFLSQGIGMGIGMGMLYVPSLSIISHHFGKRRSLAMGITISGVSIGGIVTSVLLNHLFHHPKIGFAIGVRISAAVVGVMLLAANVLMTTRLLPKKSKPDLWSTLRGFIKDPSFMWTVLSSYSITLGYQFPTFYLQLYAVTHGTNSAIAYNLLAMLNAAGTLGRILPNILADKFGPFNMYLPWLFILGTSVAAVAGVHDSAGLVAVAIFFGIAAGGYSSLSAPVVAGMAKTPDEVGISIGAGFFVSGVAVMTGPPIQGALLSRDLHWTRTIIFSAVCIFAGAIFTIRGRLLAGKQRGTQWL